MRPQRIDCTVRDGRTVSFIPERHELHIIDADGIEQVYYIGRELAIQLAAGLLDYYEDATEEYIEELKRRLEGCE